MKIYFPPSLSQIAATAFVWSSELRRRVTGKFPPFHEIHEVKERKVSYLGEEDFSDIRRGTHAEDHHLTDRRSWATGFLKAHTAIPQANKASTLICASEGRNKSMPGGKVRLRRNTRRLYIR